MTWSKRQDPSQQQHYGALWGNKHAPLARIQPGKESRGSVPAFSNKPLSPASASHSPAKFKLKSKPYFRKKSALTGGRSAVLQDYSNVEHRS